MVNLDGKKIEIKELFSRDYFYRIPEYQRPFSWEDDNFSDLIGDLLDAEKEQEYFLGTIVLHKKIEGVLEVVDGQQRLTTLMILFACLRDLVDKKDFKKSIQQKILQTGNVVDSIPEKIRLEVKDREIFNKLVVQNDGTKATIDENALPEPQWRYARAVKVFHDKLKLLKQAQIEKFAQFISQKCMMIYLSTTTFDDAFRLFTIVNDRGKQLRRIDILKANNISPKVIKSETIRKSIAQKWEEWEKELGGQAFENILHLIRFIKVCEKPQNDLLVEFEEIIFKKGLMIRGENFIDEVCAYCELYNAIFEDYTLFDGAKEKNKIIGLLHIMQSEFKASEWKAVTLAYVQKFGAVNFFEFIQHVERLYFHDWVLNARKDDRVIKYSGILKEIAAAKEPKNIFNLTQFKIDPNVIKDKIANDIYGKTYCKYALLRLELQASENDVEKKIYAKSIEHVLPQTPKEGSEWKTNFTEEEKIFWVNKIANLVLLSKSKNSSAKNYDFSEKKAKYLEKRVTDYPRSVQVLGYDSWKPSDLEKRQTEALELVIKDI